MTTSLKSKVKPLALLLAIMLIFAAFTACGDNKKKSSGSNESGLEGELTLEGEDDILRDEEGNVVDSEGNIISRVESNGSTKNQSNAKSGGSSKSTSKSKSSSGTGSGGSVNYPDPDFKGQKVVIMREWNPYTSGQNAAWDNWIKRVAQLEKRFKVDIVEQKWTATLAQESMSGVKPAGHLYQVTAGSVWSMARAGYVADWNDAMKKTGIDMTSDVYHQFNVQMCNLNSKQYAVGVEEARLNTGILFNRKMTDPIADIYDLMSKNKWTWDEMTRIAKAVRDRNEGKHAIAMDTTAVQAMAISNGTSLIGVNSGNNLVSNLNTPAVKAALEKIDEWCKTPNLTLLRQTNQMWNYLSGEFAKGNIGFLFCDEGAIGSAYNGMAANSYGFAYLPMGPNAGGKYYADMTPAYPYVLPTAYKDQSADYLFLINALYEFLPGYSKDDQFRDLWIRKFKDQQSYNAYKSYNRTVKFGFSVPVSLGTDSAPWNSAVHQLFKGEITPQGLVDTNASAYNTHLNDQWKNVRYTGTYK